MKWEIHLMEQYAISVVIPCYNCEKYIKRCINSVIAQTFKNFEVVLINDGSTDETETVCLFFAEQHDNVHYYPQENHGVSFSRKRGVTLARGRYIAFVDSDDYLENDYLETLYSAIKVNKCEMICCNSLDEADTDARYFIKQDELVLKKIQLLDAYIDGKRYAYCIWGKLIDRELLIDLEFPDMKYSEDALIVQMLFLKAKKIQLLSYAGYHYTDNPEGAMNTALGCQQPLDILKCDNFVMNEIVENYPTLISKASVKFQNDMFSLLINASSEGKMKKGKARETLTASICILPKKELFKTCKGIIIYSYTLFPEFMSDLLAIYSRTKKRFI